MKRLLLFLPLIPFLILFNMNCGGGEGSDGSGGESSANNGRIEGSIVEVIAKAPSDNQLFYSSIKKFPKIINNAYAEDGEFCGIEVMVIRQDEVIAVTETDCDGSFILENIEPGEVLLAFIFGDSELTTPIDIPPGGLVEIKVKIQEEIVVEELNVFSGPINCNDGIFEIGGDEIKIDELIIEGNGESCIVSEGSCEINLMAEDIELKGCDYCIKAKDESTILIIADSEFECDVEGENGIEAGDESEVNIDAETCSIEGDIVENQKNVNTGECEEVNTEEENNEQENNDVNEFAVCEFECGSEGCALFCDGISNDCKSQCTNAPNISACIQECSGLECGEKKCHEFCLDETLKCDVKEECDEVCVSDLICESTDICLEKECLEFSPCELVCEGEGENEECHEVCSDDCLVFGECLKFKEECHCPEENFELVCEEFEVCEEECTEFGLACRFECEGIL